MLPLVLPFVHFIHSLIFHSSFNLQSHSLSLWFSSQQSHRSDSLCCWEEVRKWYQSPAPSHSLYLYISYSLILWYFLCDICFILEGAVDCTLISMLSAIAMPLLFSSIIRGASLLNTLELFLPLLTSYCPADAICWPSADQRNASGRMLEMRANRRANVGQDADLRR